MPRRLFLTCLLAGLLLAGTVGAQAASPLLVLDSSGLTLSQQQLAASLQGIANRVSGGPRVFLLTRPSDDRWLGYAQRLDPQPLQTVTLEELLTQVKPLLKGQVLYNPAQPFTLDVATMAAGVNDAALTDTDLGLPTLYDFRKQWNSAGEAYAWMLKTLVSKLNHRQVALLPATASAMRDYAIQQKMMTFSTAAHMPPDLLQDILFHLEPGSVFFGDYIASLLPKLSDGAHYLMPASEAANLSFYATQMKDARCAQYTGHIEPVAPRYLTLIFDCADLEMALNRMPGLWENGARGSLPLGWAIPSSLATIAPLAARRYYADAYRSGTDQFVLGASGAGFTLLSRASALEAFTRATTKAADALDIHTCLFAVSGAPNTFGTQVSQIVSREGIGGVFLLTDYDQPPAIYRGVPAVVTPYIESVEQAVTYLNRIPMERRFAALCLDSGSLTPEDAAHIAAHVASRYVVVPPTELMLLMLSVAQENPSAETEGVTITSAEFPEADGGISPTAPVPVRIEIQPLENVFSASLVYRAAGSRFAYDQPLFAKGEVFQTELPPLRWGGEVEVKVRVVDTQGRVSWSPMWKLNVQRADTDGDGLSDAEEAYLLTDATRADTDGDGLRDGVDPMPLDFDHLSVVYCGPLYPPGDVPYITNPTESTANDDGRVLQPGQHANYWIPTNRLPPKGTTVINLDAEGTVAVAWGANPDTLATNYTGEISGFWHSDTLSEDAYRTGIYLRIACPAEAKNSLTLYALSLTSPSEAPSLTQVYRTPTSPGPEQPITISALAFDPKVVSEVTLSCRVNGDGILTLPMTEQSQHYFATLPFPLENRDILEYWVTARTAKGARTASVPETVIVGGRGREIVTLLARRNFVGGWQPSFEWNGAASYAPEPGVEDTAPANLTGGTYTVWVLAAGRGSEIGVSIDGKHVGSVKPNRPDGWQQVGRIRLEAGKHRTTLTAGVAPADGSWVAPRYAAVVLSTENSFTPPADQVFDIYNTLVLLAPRTEEPLSGTVELLATGAGNVTAVEFSLDGKLLKRISGPPFRYSLSTSRYRNGPHTLKLETVDRTGPTGLALEAPITIAN